MDILFIPGLVWVDLGVAQAHVSGLHVGISSKLAGSRYVECTYTHIKSCPKQQQQQPFSASVSVDQRDGLRTAEMTATAPSVSSPRADDRRDGTG